MLNKNQAKQLTITAKVQIKVPAETSTLLDATSRSYCDACNFVSSYIYKTHDLKVISLHKELYKLIREKFHLKSQMAESVIRTVIAKYRTIKKNQKRWIKPIFGVPSYDLVWNSDYSLKQDIFSVNTSEGRVKLGYYSAGMEKYFLPENHDKYKFGTATIVKRHKKYYLHIPVTFEVENFDVTNTDISDISNIIGIDRGLNFTAVTYDSNQQSIFYNGRKNKQIRGKYQKLRNELQERGTRSSKRKLKEMSGRENRWMQDVNHCITKALVSNNPSHSVFVLEELTNFKTESADKLSKYNPNKKNISNWSYYDFEQKLKYKAEIAGSTVIKVNPKYTSQRCPVCGCIEKDNRDKRLHQFHCINCGYNSNDDRIGAMNLYRMGVSYITTHEVPDIVTCGHIPHVRGVTSSTPRCDDMRCDVAVSTLERTCQSQAHHIYVVGR